MDKTAIAVLRTTAKSVLVCTLIYAFLFGALVHWKRDNGEPFGAAQRAELSAAAKSHEAQQRSNRLAKRQKRLSEYRESKRKEMVDERQAENKRILDINQENARASAEAAAAAEAEAAVDRRQEVVIPVDVHLEYEPGLLRAIESFEASIDNHQQVLNGLENLHERMQQMTEEVATLEIEEKRGTEIPPLQDTVELLSQPSLADLSNAILASLFRKAISELTYVKDNHDSVAWGDVEANIFKDYPEKERSKSVAICPIFKKKDVDMEDLARIMNDPDVAKMSDLEAEIERFGVLFRRRKPGSPVYSKILPRTMKNIESALKENVGSAIQNIVDVTQENQRRHEEQSGCISYEDLNDVLDEVTEAIYREGDLREVIQREMMRINPSAKSIILDAEMPLPQTDVRPAPRKLRHIIDSELVSKRMGDWIDGLYDNMIAGQIEQLDVYIESLEQSEKERVGSIIVSVLLENAGRVNIPRTKEILSFVKDTIPPEVMEKVKEVTGVKWDD